MAKTKGEGAPPLSSKQQQQMMMQMAQMQQQQQQQQQRGAGAGKGGRPQQQQQQQQQQRAPKQQHPHRPAAASSSSAAAAPAGKSQGKKKKQAAVEVEEESAEEAEEDAQEEEEAEFEDDYNADTLDGLKIAFGSTGGAPASAAAAAAPAVANAFRLADKSDEPVDPLRNKAGIEHDSGLTAQRFFEWLIYPLSIESFYENYFEQKPLFIARRNVSAMDQPAAVTLVTTHKTLAQLLPREDEPAPWYAPGASPLPKLSATSIHDWKTEKNALRTEKVTTVEIESMVSRIENREDGALPASAASATADASASSAAAAVASATAPGVLPHYYSDWFSIPDIHRLLSDPTHKIEYRNDIDITRYKNGVRETLNPQGLATDAQVRTFLRQQDCSLRFLCPQKFSPKLWRMCNLLDEFFGMQVGANSYYTPRGTQGFAPHFDDVDIFVIQTEGCKRWRFYAPRAEGELLPNYSSPNYSQAEIGSPVMDVTLRAGDFLYAPRGAIHQCVAAAEVDSLHVTLSTCLNTNWGSYFGIMLPRMLTLASEEHLAFRRSLPHKYERYMGVMHSDSDSRGSGGQREEFMGQFMDLLTQMVASEDSLPFDAAADQMQTQFMHGRVPPMLLEAEKRRTVAGASADPKQRKKLFRGSTCIRLVKDGVARLTASAKGDSISVHHILANSRLYQDHPLACLEFPVGYAPTIEALIRAYPKYVRLESLPPPEPEEGEDGAEMDVAAKAAEADLIELVESLFEEGLLEVTNDAASIEPDMIKTGESSDEESEGGAMEGEEQDQEDPEDDGDEDAYEGMEGEEEDEEEQ